jgi:hypothetical protein
MSLEYDWTSNTYHSRLDVQTGARRHGLRQCLTELSKGDQGNDGITREIALAARGNPLQLWITLSSYVRGQGLGRT